MKTFTVEQVRNLAGRSTRCVRSASKSRSRRKKSEYLAQFLATPPASEMTAESQERQRALFDVHDRVAVSIRLPLAPTVNNYYMDIVFPGKKYSTKVKSAEGNAFFEVVEYFWKRHFAGWPPEPITGRVRLLVVAHMARNGRSDLSNRWKALEDALTACGAWVDDSQIDDERMRRGDVIPGSGAMDVIIETIGD